MGQVDTHWGRKAKVALVVLLAACSSSPTTRTRGAFAACEQFVKQHTPSVVAFPDPFSQYVTTKTSRHGDVERVSFDGQVDLKTMRAQFTCTVRTTDGGATWTSEGVSVDAS